MQPLFGLIGTLGGQYLQGKQQTDLIKFQINQQAQAQQIAAQASANNQAMMMQLLLIGGGVLLLTRIL